MTAAQKREVLEELRGNPLWQVHVQNRYWICPCCGQIGSAWKEPKEMLAEVLGHIRNRCPRSRNQKGQILLKLLLQFRLKIKFPLNTLAYLQVRTEVQNL